MQTLDAEEEDGTESKKTKKLKHTESKKKALKQAFKDLEITTGRGRGPRPSRKRAITERWMLSQIQILRERMACDPILEPERKALQQLLQYMRVW